VSRPITERDVQLAIVRDLGSSIVCAAPNYTPGKWWECDLWTVTRSGYAVEYEIKMSIADFMADAEKGRNRFDKSVGVVHEDKHQLIGIERGPSRFFFVVNADIESKVMERLPAWAGLIVFQRDRYHVRQWTVRDAPRLHQVRVSRREILLCQRRMWFRYWKVLRHLNDVLTRTGVTA